jgi:hypothetical protein
MKKILLATLIFTCGFAIGQTAGDIAFVGYNTDGLKAFSIVVLNEIDGSGADKVIYFTDDNWNGSALAGGEGTIIWSINSLIVAGTVIDFTDVSNDVAVSVGSASENSAFSPINGSDAVYAYIGTLGTPTTFLAAITNDDFTNDSFLLTGTGLTVGTDAIELDAIDTDADIGEYTGTRIGTKSALLSAINSTSNWITQDDTGDQSIDAIEPDLPFNNENFIVSSGSNLTWDGSEGDNDWTNGDNWDGGVVPTSADNVVLADVTNDPIISDGTEASCYNLTVNSGSVLSVDTGGSLAIFGSVTNNGTCFFEKGLGDNGYSIIGSPVTNETIDALGVDHFYSNTNGSGFSANLKNSTDVMTPGQGYFAAFNGATTNPTFEGTPNSGDITYTVNNSSGFELVANPYATAISISDFLSDNSSVITGGVYFWDDGGSNVSSDRGGDYITATAMGTASAVQPGGVDDGVAGSKGTTGADNGYIPSIQGVFVEVQATGTITFSPDQMTTADGSNYDGNYYRKAEYQKVKLAMEGNDLYNEVLIGLGEDATYGIDSHLDSRKFESGSPLSFYSLIEDQKYVIQGLPLATSENVSAPLGFDLTESGTFTLSVIDFENISENVNVTLLDHLTGASYDLRSTKSFEFTTEIVSNDRRFELQFSPNDILSVDRFSSELKLIGNTSELTIQSLLEGEQKVIIYSLDGKVAFKENVRFSNSNTTINPSLTQNKVYVLRIGEQSFKFVIQ